MNELLPLQYLHLETVLLIPFLAMVLLAQFSRSGELHFSLRYLRIQAFALLGIFFILALAMSTYLYTVSLLLAIELAIGFALALMHPVNALCFFVHMLFLRPWDIVTDNPLLLALPRLLAATCFLSWALHPLTHRTPSTRTSRALTLLGAFGVWLFLSTFITPHIAESQADWFGTFFKSLIIFVMCSFFIESERSVSEYKYTILFSVFAMAVLGFYQFFWMHQSRLSAVSMLDPNDLAAISVMTIPLALAPVFSPVKGMSQRIIGVLFCVVSLIAIWYSQSRGALLALGVQIIGFQILKNFPKHRLLTLLMIGGIGMAYISVLGTLKRSSDDLDASSETRVTYWKAAVNMALHHPFLGVGYEQFPEKYESYSSSLKYEWGKRTAHSSWLLAFAESGFLGGALFVSFFLTVLGTAWKNRQVNPDQFYALAGYGVAMTFLSHTYLLFPYLLYGLILASDSVRGRSILES